MSERPIPVSEVERERQRVVLGDLLERAGLRLTPAAARIGVSASQLSRYLSGETILPTPYYSAVATAFGISASELARRLGLVTAEPAGLRAELDALFPEDSATVEAALRDLSHRSPRQRGEALARIRALIRSDSE